MVTLATPPATVSPVTPGNDDTPDSVGYIEELNAPLPESLGTFTTLRVARFPNDGGWRAASRLGYTFDDAKCIDKTPTDAMDGYGTREAALSVCAEAAIALWQKLPSDPRFVETIRILKLWQNDKLPKDATYPPFETDGDAAPPVGFVGYDFNVFLDAVEIPVPIRDSIPITATVRVGLRKDGLWGWGVFVSPNGLKENSGLDDQLTAKSMTAPTRRQAILDAAERLLALWRPVDMRLCIDLNKFVSDVEEGLFDADTAGELPLDELQDPGFVTIEDGATEQPAAEASAAVTEGAEGSASAQAEPTDAANASAASAAGESTTPTAVLETGNSVGKATVSNRENRTPLEFYEERVQEAEKNVADLSLAVEAAKENVKFKKKELREAMEYLSQLHADGPPKPKAKETKPEAPKPAAEPVVASDKPQEQATATLTLGGENVTVTTSEIQVAAGPVDPNAWRAVPIADLGMLPGLTAILAENPDKPIVKLGDLADWTQAGRKLTEIRKVGEAKAEKIEEAMDNFWRAHPEFTR